MTGDGAMGTGMAASETGMVSMRTASTGMGAAATGSSGDGRVGDGRDRDRGGLDEDDLNGDGGGCRGESRDGDGRDGNGRGGDGDGRDGDGDDGRLLTTVMSIWMWWAGAVCVAAERGEDPRRPAEEAAGQRRLTATRLTSQGSLFAGSGSVAGRQPAPVTLAAPWTAAAAASPPRRDAMANARRLPVHLRDGGDATTGAAANARCCPSTSGTRGRHGRRRGQRRCCPSTSGTRRRHGGEAAPATARAVPPCPGGASQWNLNFHSFVHWPPRRGRRFHCGRLGRWSRIFKFSSFIQ